jgi:hypothetical protein
MNIIRLSRFEAALQEVLSNPVISIKQKENSSSSTITTAHGSSSSSGHHSSNSTSTANTSTTATSTTAGLQKISNKADLHAYVKEHLGGFYMHYHSVGYGTHLQLEDAQAALRAYWRICEKRLNEDVESAVDMLLLQKCSEIIETNLLTNVQEWINNENKLNNMIAENEKIREERIQLLVLRSNIKNALEKLDEIIPGCVPKNPFTL